MIPEPGEMPRPLVLVPEYLPPKHLEMLAQRVEVVYDPDLHGDRDRLLASVAEASAVLIRNRTVIDPAFLAAASGLQVVGSWEWVSTTSTSRPSRRLASSWWSPMEATRCRLPSLSSGRCWFAGEVSSG